MLTRLAPVALAVGLLTPAATGHAASEEDEGLLRDGFVSHLDAFFASKLMDSDWEDDSDNETLLYGFGAGYSIRGLSWPVGIHLAYAISDNETDSGESSLDSQDLQIGLFYAWGEGRGLRIEAGGGYHWTEVELERKGALTPGEVRSTEVRASGVYGRGALRYGIANWLDVMGSASFIYAPEDGGDDETVNAGGILITAGASLRF